MDKKITFDIPYIRLCFRTEILEHAQMPETKTAALRGGMGEMILKQNCVTDKNCGECRFKKACVVMHTFYSSMEKKPAYVTGEESVGYLIECADKRTEFAKGSRFEFSLVLFGDSIAFFNIYLQAFYQLGLAGIGRHRARFRILEVCNTQGMPIVCGNEVDMGRYQIETVEQYISQRKKRLRSEDGLWTLTFLTPLSMKYQQKYMDEFYADALVKGAARRVQMLDYYTGTETDVPDFCEYPGIRWQMVRKEKVKRYSGTQDARITLRGISGKVVFESMPEDCLDYLIAGELTHVGRNSSFGFGKYVLRREREDQTCIINNKYL